MPQVPIQLSENALAYYMSKVIPPSPNNRVQLINKMVSIPMFGTLEDRFDIILEALHILLGWFG